MIKTLKFFKKIGLLGMNRRNCQYTLTRNPRAYYPLVDDKLITKDLLLKNGLPVPPTYCVFHYEFELHYLLKELQVREQFVIKPARGAEGRGILVIKGRPEKDRWKRASGELLSQADIEYHISNILGGLYSLGGVNDKAFIEYCVQSHGIFDPVTYQGVPDIRIILYRGVPVMSMLRLPTKESGGRANLHQGAVGAGIDILKGESLAGVHHNKLIDIHPDTHVPIAGISIPYWDEILSVAARTFSIFKLGYLGIDFVIDNAFGPMILELNARPGLNIQLANRAGLLPRLKAVDAVPSSVEEMEWRRRTEISREILSRLAP